MSWITLRPLMAIGAVAPVLVCPSLSAAGTYEVNACTASVGYVNNSWVLYGNGPTQVEANTVCGQAPTHEFSAKISNLAVADIMNTEDPPVGVEAGWRFSAPPGAMITEVEGSDDLFKDNNNNWEVYLKDARGDILGGQTCTVELASSIYCEVSGLFQEPGIDTPSVTVGVACTENSFHNRPSGATIHEVRAELDYATVTISDETVPTKITGTQIPIGLERGVVPLLGSAVDDIAGLLSLSVVNAAGEVVGGPIAAPVACDYSFVTPCEREVKELAIPLDTTKLPNGQNEIRVEATNAAHDEGFSVPYDVTIENGTATSGREESPPNGGGQKGSSGGTVGGSGGTQSAIVGKSSGVAGSLPMSVVPPVLSRLASAIFDVKTVRSSRSLALSGRVSKAATGTIHVLIHVRLANSRIWTRRLLAAIRDGRFRALIKLPSHIGGRGVAVRLTYPGDARYLRTTATVDIHS